MKIGKKIITMLLVLAMTVSLMGCGSDKTTDSKSGKNGKSVKTLTLLMYTDWYKSGWQALEKYINSHSDKVGFKLEISKIQGGQQGDQVIQTKFATDDLPDLIQVYKPMWVDSYANGLDKLVDLSGIKSESEYDKKALNGTFIYKKKLYAMPIDSIVLSGVFYNKKVFKKAGVEIPKTWKDFLNVCKVLKSKNIVPVYYSGKDAWSVQPPTISGMLLDAEQAGTDTYGLMDQINTHKKKFSDCKNFIDGIQKSKELIDKKYVNDSYLSDTVDSAHQALAEGKCAMYINGTWCADNIQQKFPKQSNDIGAFAIPTDDGNNYINMFTPYSLALTKQCKDTELGKKAIEFITSAKAQQIYADAQPGLYLNKKIKCTMPAATADLQKIMNDGKSMTDWEEINKYSYGNLSEPLLNYYTGALKNASDVAKVLDDETGRNAVAKGDPNWK